MKSARCVGIYLASCIVSDGASHTKIMQPVTSTALFVFYAFKRILRLLPMNTVCASGKVLGKVISHFFPREQKISEAQIYFVQNQNTLSDELRSYPDCFTRLNKLKNSQPKQLYRELFAHIGESVAETFLLDKLISKRSNSPNEFKYISHTGQEIVSEFMQKQQGTLTLSGHIGCFELLAAFHAAWGAKITVIAREANYPALAYILQELRKAYGVETLLRDDKSTTRKLIGAIKTGRVVAALIDQDTALESIYCPFFGVDASYPSALIGLAIRQNLPILSSFIVRISRLQHHVITKQIHYNPKDPEASRQVLIQFNRSLEELICQFPEQWIWWHRRWRRRPNFDYSQVKLLSTNEYLEWLNGN